MINLCLNLSIDGLLLAGGMVGVIVCSAQFIKQCKLFAKQRVDVCHHIINGIACGVESCGQGSNLLILLANLSLQLLREIYIAMYVQIPLQYLIADVDIYGDGAEKEYN